jgi:hypothetical protein
MKQLPDPPLPATFWPHAFLQMSAFVGYMLLLEPQGIFPRLQIRLGELGAATGWGLPFVVWIVFVFLIVERLIRLSQHWATLVYPFQKGWFNALTTLCAVPMMFVAFVALECVLYFMALGRYPMQFGADLFRQGFLLTLQSDAPLLIVLLLGELLRQGVYRHAIAKWHRHRGLRLLPAVEQSDD